MSAIVMTRDSGQQSRALTWQIPLLTGLKEGRGDASVVAEGMADSVSPQRHRSRLRSHFAVRKASPLKAF